MPKKRIFIAQTPDKAHNYQNALTQLGAGCLFLTDREPEDADALVLPGGGDIDPALFGEANHGSRIIEPVLDRRQLALLDQYAKRGLPVLGICKGMQLINVCLGGGIIQDLPTARSHAYVGRDQIHPSFSQKGSILHSLYGESFPVNSAHHQGISEPGEGLAVIQRAPDGVAEAVVHRRLPLIGVQWHPERMCFSHRRPDTPDGSRLLSYFLSLVPITSDQSEMPI